MRYKHKLYEIQTHNLWDTNTGRQDTIHKDKRQTHKDKIKTHKDKIKTHKDKT